MLFYWNQIQKYWWMFMEESTMNINCIYTRTMQDTFSVNVQIYTTWILLHNSKDPFTATGIIKP